MAEEEAERVRRHQVQQEHKERLEVERRASIEREREDLSTKGKAKEQSLNSPPASLKGTRTKNRLGGSRSLLKALVAYVALFLCFW